MNIGLDLSKKSYYYFGDFFFCTLYLTKFFKNMKVKTKVSLDLTTSNLDAVLIFIIVGMLLQKSVSEILSLLSVVLK